MTAQPHPSESAESIEAIRSWSESNGYQNIRFGEPGSYSSVVANADVVLCEFPSTTFLEALWAGVPVILYQLSGAYELVDRYFEELGDAIHMVSNSAELIEVLANLRNGCNVSMCQFAKAEALIVGRVSGFSGEHQLWQSILK